MSNNDGQSLVPYPWRERKKFNDSRRLISPVVKVTRILAWIGTIASPPSFVLWMWAKFGFRRYNDSWRKRGLILLVFGVAASLIFVRDPMSVPTAWLDMLRSFGPDSPDDPVQAIITAVLAALPYATILQSVHALARTYQVEKTTNAFLQEQRPTLWMRLRKRRNMKTLSQGIDTAPEGEGYVRFGVVEDDRIPWRRSRYGMIVERKIAKMGHGVLIGANGMGKTKAAETFTHYVLRNNSAMIYIDFKASLSTLRGLAAVARENGRPCYILDIGFGTTDTSWYDLFAWAGSPADKASVLVECFQFAEGEGGAAYYRGIAEAWLPMQIEAAELLGLGDGEGMFDFLLDTAIPLRFQQRIAPLRESSDPTKRAKFEKWNEEAKHVKGTDLQGLRNELNKIINAAGDRLKPNAQNPNPVSMKEVMDNGGLVYIGIASGINDVVVKVLGSFLFKELSILVSARSRVPDANDLRDVFVIPDEASEMEERSVMMNPIYTMAREARVFIWPSFQSFAVWDESTQEEIQSNARNFVAFSIPSRDTAEKISTTLSDVFALKQMSQEETRQQSFQNQTVGISGDARLEVVTDAFLRPNIELPDVPAFHAYIWFKDAPRISRQKWRGRKRVRKDENRADAPLVKLIPYDLVMPDGIDPALEVLSDVPESSAPVVLPDDAESRQLLSAVPRAERTTPEEGEGEPVGSGEDSWRDYIVTSEEPRHSPTAHQAVEARDTEGGDDGEREERPVRSPEAEPTSAPALPSFAVRGAHRRRDAAVTASATAVATEEGAARHADTSQADAAPAPDTVDDAPATASADATTQSEPVTSPGGAESALPEPWEDDDFADDGAATDGSTGEPGSASVPLARGVQSSTPRAVVPAEPEGGGAVVQDSNSSDTSEFADDGMVDKDAAPADGAEAVANTVEVAADSQGGAVDEPSQGPARKEGEESNASDEASADDASVASDDEDNWFV